MAQRTKLTALRKSMVQIVGRSAVIGNNKHVITRQSARWDLAGRTQDHSTQTSTQELQQIDISRQSQLR